MYLVIFIFLICVIDSIKGSPDRCRGYWNILLSICCVYKYICLHTRALSGQHSDPCALSALEPFFGDFSAARPRFVARLAPSDSPQPRGPCPRAGPPSPRPSLSASAVARSRLHGLPTRAPITALFLYNDQSVGVLLQPRGHALFFFGIFLVLDRHGLGAAAAAACCCCCPQHQY